MTRSPLGSGRVTGIAITHPLLESWRPRWRQARDLAAGEAAVKAAGECYLPCPSSYRDVRGAIDKPRYEAYKGRARFMEVLEPSAFLFVSRLFSRSPEVNVPERLLSSIGAGDTEAGKRILETLARRVARELVLVGRFGVRVDFDGQIRRPYLIEANAESIVNWRESVDGGDRALKMAVIEQMADQESKDPYDHEERPMRFSMRLDDGRLLAETWGKKTDGEWELLSEAQPMLEGARPFEFIPLHIFGVNSEGAEIDRPLLEPLGNAVLRAYETSAWLRTGLFYAGCPTPWMADTIEEESGHGSACVVDSCSGYVPPGANNCSDCGTICSAPAAQADPVRLGSDDILMMSAGGEMGYLEPKGSGFGALRQEVEDIREEIVALGARFLRVILTGGTQGGTATAEAIAREVEVNKVQSIRNMIDTGMTRLLRWAGQMQGLSDSEVESITYRLDSSFGDQPLDWKAIVELAGAWRSGNIPLQVILDMFKSAGAIDKSWTQEDWDRAMEDGGSDLL